MNADAKEFELSNGNKVYIGQFETVDLQAVLGREAEIREAIKALVAEKGYQFVLFFATDILAEGSQFICEGDTEFVNKVFGIVSPAERMDAGRPFPQEAGCCAVLAGLIEGRPFGAGLLLSHGIVCDAILRVIPGKPFPKRCERTFWERFALFMV